VRAARSAALAELQELQEAYTELQQQHGTLQVTAVTAAATEICWRSCMFQDDCSTPGGQGWGSAAEVKHCFHGTASSCGMLTMPGCCCVVLMLSQAKHQLLQEEHSQLLNRQLGVTSDRGSLRQQYLSTEEQLQASKKQVRCCDRPCRQHAKLHGSYTHASRIRAMAHQQTCTCFRSTSPHSCGHHENGIKHQCAVVLCIMQVAELQQKVLALRASQAATTPRSPTAAQATGTAGADSSGSSEQQLQQQQLMLSMAADNARLAVALAELMEETDRLQQQQQLAHGSIAAPQMPELYQQRLQLLVSQLVVARDQAAGAANHSALQQEQLALQQQQLAQTAADLVATQQQYAQLQRQHLQQAQAAVVAAVMAAAEPGSAAVAQVRLPSKQPSLQMTMHPSAAP
jgi:hypothetical protein